jgi:hypothetical protein
MNITHPKTTNDAKTAGLTSMDDEIDLETVEVEWRIGGVLCSH